MKKFIFLEHTADIKFQAFGKNLKEVFRNSALALKEAITEDKIKEKVKEKICLHIEGGGIESALVDFLQDFLLLFDTKGFLVSKIKKIKVEEKSGAYFIICEMTGDNAKNYKISDYVKAITYNEMFVKKIKENWTAQVVLDV